MARDTYSLIRTTTAGGVFGISRPVVRLAPGADLGEISALARGGIFGGLRASLLGRPIVGLAVPYGDISSPAGDSLTDDGRRKRFRFAMGSFADSLAAIRSGRLSVSLLREHEWGRDIGSTADGDWLTFEETGQGLRLRIDTASARGQIVARLMKREPRWNLSAGFRAIDFTTQRLADGTTLFDVTRATLGEVSILRRGAFEGTYLYQL